jgi:hypothetical protein
MTDNRRFLLADIKAMLPQSKQEFAWLILLSDEGLYHLWQDLVNLTTQEATQ